jgi:hypothetical protein
MTMNQLRVRVAGVGIAALIALPFAMGATAQQGTPVAAAF